MPQVLPQGGAGVFGSRHPALTAQKAQRFLNSQQCRIAMLTNLINNGGYDQSFLFHSLIKSVSSWRCNLCIGANRPACTFGGARVRFKRPEKSHLRRSKEWER